MRWLALGVDYEMAGKDLIDSVKLSGEICRALGAVPPEGFNYELFLDEKGQKISKSKGNGLGMTNTQNIILNHKGKIEVMSEEGNGTSFIITLNRKETSV